MGSPETVFEERVGRAVAAGVPTKADIQKLTERVEELTKQVQKLNGGKAAPAVARRGEEAGCAQAGRQEGRRQVGAGCRFTWLVRMNESFLIVRWIC